MMNLIALSLIATSFAAAGVFSPNPKNGKEQVIVKDGHRAVVVEYADTAGDGNTKVLISPSHPTPAATNAIEDQLSRATASVAGVAQEAQNVHHTGARELICDAYGKCKHKITGAWSKAKEKVVDAEEEVKDVVEGAVDKAKDLASKATHKAEEGTEAVREKAKEKVKEAGEAAGRVKGKAGEKAREAGEMAKETAEKVAGKTGEVAGKTGEAAEEAAEKIKEQGRKGKKEFSDIATRGKEVVFDTFRYVFRPESMSSLMSTVQMIGFATAYGISVWVTFIMSHVLAGALPRQQFGMVQSKMYPVYFKAMVGSVGMALLGHLLGQRSKVFKNKSEMFQAYILLASMLSPLVNLLFLEPEATKVMFERMKLEKEEGRGRDRAPTRVIDTVVTDSDGPNSTTSTMPSEAATTTTTTTSAAPAPLRAEQEVAKSKMGKLDERLKKLNSYSSLLNIMTLMGLTWHLVYLSHRLGVNTSY